MPPVDKEFLNASAQEKIAYLSSVDPEFKSASPQEQMAYIRHVTGDMQPAGSSSVEVKPNPPGFLKSFGSDLVNAAKGAIDPKNLLLNAATLGMGSTFQTLANAPETLKHYGEQKKAGYSLPYRMLTPVAEGMGANVRGMEQSAKEGDMGGVLGHAATPLAELGAAEVGAHVLPAIRGAKPLGHPDNPGPMAKLPMRVPASVLREESMGHGAPAYRDATLNKRNIPEFAGEGEDAPSQTLSPLGTARPRGRMGPPLRPNVFASPEDAQIYDAQMSRLGAEAKDAGMYSAARGAVRRIPDYQERIGSKLRPFGPPEDLMEESTPPVRRKVENE